MDRTRLRGALVVLALWSALAAPAGAQHVTSTDDDIQARVESRLFDEGLAGVRVDVWQRTVALSGEVESLWQQDRAIRQARKVRDVALVVSGLTISRGESDAAIAREIATDVTESSRFSIFDDVNVRVAGGEATLTGYVTTDSKSEEFTTVTSKVPGVQKIVNQIETLPASMVDDDLRDALANAIYRHPMFAPYALQRVGPIHIIVRHGHVTLTGVVATESEKWVAGMLVQGTSGVVDCDNQVHVSEQSGPLM